MSDVLQIDYEFVCMFDAYVRRDGEIYHGLGFTIDEALDKARAALVPASVTFLTVPNESWGGSLTEFAPEG